MGAIEQCFRKREALTNELLTFAQLSEEGKAKLFLCASHIKLKQMEMEDTYMTDEDRLTARGRSDKSDKKSRGKEGNLQDCSCFGELKMAGSPASSLLPYWSIPGY